MLFLKYKYMENTVNERIKIIIDLFFNGNTSEFARSIGMKQPALRDVIGTKQVKPGYDTLARIVENSTIGIDANWLLTGKGIMELPKENGDYIPGYNYGVLQHYTPPDGLIGILREMKLYFSKQERSNDIKERRLSYHHEVENMPIDKKKEKKESVAKYKWVSFFIKDERREVRQPKMYDLYAGFHKGGCIEFNKEKLKALNSHLDIEFCEVKYASSFKDSEEKETVRNELEYKYYQWRDEKEYRIIYHGCAESIKINIDCIERIYLGCEFFEDIIKVGELCEIIDEQDIPIEKITQVNVVGIGYLSSVSDKNSPHITKAGDQVPKLLPYLSEEYRERYNITEDEYKRINYREEQYYKGKYRELEKENRKLLEENSDLSRMINEHRDVVINFQSKIIKLKDNHKKETDKLNKEIKRLLEGGKNIHAEGTSGVMDAQGTGT
jgi:hypothetical protein